MTSRTMTSPVTSPAIRDKLFDSLFAQAAAASLRGSACDVSEIVETSFLRGMVAYLSKRCPGFGVRFLAALGSDTTPSDDIAIQITVRVLREIALPLTRPDGATRLINATCNALENGDKNEIRRVSNAPMHDALLHVACERVCLGFTEPFAVSVFHGYSLPSSLVRAAQFKYTQPTVFGETERRILEQMTDIIIEEIEKITTQPC